VRKIVRLKQQKSYLLNILNAYVSKWEQIHHRNYWWNLCYFFSIFSFSQKILKKERTKILIKKKKQHSTNTKLHRKMLQNQE